MEKRKFNENDMGITFIVKDNKFSNYPEYSVTVLEISSDNLVVWLGYPNGKITKVENKEWYIVGKP